MFVYHGSTSDVQPCTVCGKKTAHYKAYKQSSMEIKVPACYDWDNEDNDCYSAVDIQKMAVRFLIQAKKEIRRGSM